MNKVDMMKQAVNQVLDELRNMPQEEFDKEVQRYKYDELTGLLLACTNELYGKLHREGVKQTVDLKTSGVCFESKVNKLKKEMNNEM
jgi:hypothetical protein